MHPAPKISVFVIRQKIVLPLMPQGSNTVYQIWSRYDNMTKCDQRLTAPYRDLLDMNAVTLYIMYAAA